MKFLLLLSAVAFVFGTVNCDCNNSERDRCKTIKEGLTAADACRAANDVRGCVIRIAKCTEESANQAAMELVKEKNMKCSDDPSWEKEGMCITREAKCEEDYNVAIKDVTDKDKICQAIEGFQKCAVTKCAVETVEKRMTTYMKRANIDKCENIKNDMCIDFAKFQSCELAFGSAKLDLGADEVTLCMLANSVEHCFQSKAKCQPETTKRAIERMLNKLDCSEYVDLCDHEKEELCGTRHPTPNNCEKLKEYRSCLTLNATCPAGRVHHILRNIMTDQKFDCSDVDTCEAKKESDCDIDVTQKDKSKEQQCQLFKQYPKCLVRANCNDQYMNSRMAIVNDQLGHPCGASSMLASIGLTLLLAAFTGQWK